MAKYEAEKAKFPGANDDVIIGNLAGQKPSFQIATATSPPPAPIPASIPFPKTVSPLQTSSEDRTAENNIRAQSAGLLSDLEIDDQNYQAFGQSQQSADEQARLTAISQEQERVRRGEYTTA